MPPLERTEHPFTSRVRGHTMGGMPMISAGIRKTRLLRTNISSAITLLRRGLFAFFLIPAFATGGNAQEAEIEFLEKKIRPVLVARCYKCHSAESKKLKGKLLFKKAFFSMAAASKFLCHLGLKTARNTTSLLLNWVKKYGVRWETVQKI